MFEAIMRRDIVFFDLEENSAGIIIIATCAEWKLFYD